jgi:DDE_Tnp_1-associated
MLEALITEFEAIEDPRCAWRVEHRLVDILVIAVCAVIGEAGSFEDIALYGRCKRAWLEQFLALPNGIPSHDTFRRVFTLVDPDAFERCFLGWVRAVFRSDEGAPRQVAIDGKTVRRSFDRRKRRSPLHLVSAYATERGLVLGQPEGQAQIRRLGRHFHGHADRRLISCVGPAEDPSCRRSTAERAFKLTRARQGSSIPPRSGIYPGPFTGAVGMAASVAWRPCRAVAPEAR